MVNCFFPHGWTRFIETYWDQAPMVARSATAYPITTGEEIFDCLRRLGRQFRLDGDRPTDLPTHERSPQAENCRSYVKLLFDNKRLLGTAVESLLPYSSDQDLISYFSRIREAAGNSGVLLYVTDFQLYAPELWERICSFLLPLYEKVGMPGGYADIELFMGQYDTTSGGVHRDTGANFHFVVSGEKTMHVWPRTTFWRTANGPNDQRVSAFDPMAWKNHLEDADTLDAVAGDMFYWAPNHWHVGELPAFSASINIALYQYGRATDCVSAAIVDAVNVSNDIQNWSAGDIENWSPQVATIGGVCGVNGVRVPSFPFLAKNCVDQVANLPPDIQRFFGLMRSPGFSKEMESAVIEAWLRRTTGFAFGSVPSKLDSKPLRHSDLVQNTSPLPILWAVTGDDELVYSARGHSARIRNDTAITGILSRISEGRPDTVYDLVQQCSCSTVAASAIAVIEDLYRMRAITLSPA